ncbi:MAG: hypothetical protein MHM6MM_005132 [Cercozoa sp. M6MM]
MQELTEWLDLKPPAPLFLWDHTSLVDCEKVRRYLMHGIKRQLAPRETDRVLQAAPHFELSDLLPPEVFPLLHRHNESLAFQLLCRCSQGYVSQVLRHLPLTRSGVGTILSLWQHGRIRTLETWNCLVLACTRSRSAASSQLDHSVHTEESELPFPVVANAMLRLLRQRPSQGNSDETCGPNLSQEDVVHLGNSAPQIAALCRQVTFTVLT